MESDVVVTSLRPASGTCTLAGCDIRHITLCHNAPKAVTLRVIALYGPDSHADGLDPFPGTITLRSNSRDFRRSAAEFENDIRTLLTGRM